MTTCLRHQVAEKRWPPEGCTQGTDGRGCTRPPEACWHRHTLLAESLSAVTRGLRACVHTCATGASCRHVSAPDSARAACVQTCAAGASCWPVSASGSVRAACVQTSAASASCWHVSASDSARSPIRAAGMCQHQTARGLHVMLAVYSQASERCLRNLPPPSLVPSATPE